MIHDWISLVPSAHLGTYQFTQNLDPFQEKEDLVDIFQILGPSRQTDTHRERKRKKSDQITYVSTWDT